MEFDLKNIKELENLMVPHIALTTFKYRAKASALLKKIKSDITIDQFIILKLLSAHGPLSQQQVAEMLYKDKSNLSRMVYSLEEKGCIGRKLDIKNNRAVKVLHITKKGLALVEKLSVLAVKIHKNSMKGISGKEFELIKQIMHRIRTNLDRELEFSEIKDIAL